MMMYILALHTVHWTRITLYTYLIFSWNILCIVWSVVVVSCIQIHVRLSVWIVYFVFGIVSVVANEKTMVAKLVIVTFVMIYCSNGQFDWCISLKQSWNGVCTLMVLFCFYGWATQMKSSCVSDHYKYHGHQYSI